MAARCLGCDGTVMPFKRAMFYLRPTATCPHCGRKVRIRYWGILWAAMIALVGAWVVVLLLAESAKARGVATAAMAVLSLGLEWWVWKALPWVVEDELE